MEYFFCGEPIKIKGERAYGKDNNFLGLVYTDEFGGKHLIGKYNKGTIQCKSINK